MSPSPVGGGGQREPVEVAGIGPVSFATAAAFAEVDVDVPDWVVSALVAAPTADGVRELVGVINQRSRKLAELRAKVEAIEFAERLAPTARSLAVSSEMSFDEAMRGLLLAAEVLQERDALRAKVAAVEKAHADNAEQLRRNSELAEELAQDATAVTARVADHQAWKVAALDGMHGHPLRRPTVTDPEGHDGITQTIVVDQINDVPGNCLQAAIATLLRLPLEAVPHFLLFDHWQDVMTEWLEQFDFVWKRHNPQVQVSGRYIAVGPSPRGVSHSCVAEAGQVVWDPHPSRDGLLSVDEIWQLIHLDDAPRDRNGVVVVTRVEGHAPTGDETVATARNARRRFHATLIGVAPYLEKPYTDDPRWTPWTRFVRPMIDMVDAAFASLLAARDAEKARADELSEALSVAIGKIVEIGRAGQQKIADEKARADRAEAQVAALDRHTRANFVPFEAHEAWKGRALAAEAEVERLRSNLRAANTTIEEAFAEADAESADMPTRTQILEVQAAMGPKLYWGAVAEVASLRAQLDAMGEAREEWRVSGQTAPSLPYLFVFGKPNEADKTGSPEQRARGFVAMTSDRTESTEGPYLARRVIRESSWVPVDTGDGEQ